jgi:sugar transferase (PEP-CTERM system associated)
MTAIEFLADSVLAFIAVVLAAGPAFGDLARHGSIVRADEQTLAEFAAEFALVMALMYSFVGLYRRGAVSVSPLGVLRRCAIAILLGSCIALARLSVLGEPQLVLQMLFPMVLYLAVGSMLVRGLSSLGRRSTVGVKRVLILGTGEEAQRVAREIRADKRSGAVIVGFCSSSADSDFGSARPGYFLSGTPVHQIARENRVNEIVVAMREQRGGAVPMDELLECRLSGISVIDLAAFYERAKGEIPIDSLKGSWLVYGEGFVQGWQRAAIKRSFDVLFSLLLLLISLPVLLCAMLAIRLESPGPVLYRQERVGLRARPFMCLKLRSMRTDAESSGVAQWATRNDPRITRVGALLRKTRVDEIPQLFSVLRGEMSLVGPRPERPYFVEQLRKQVPYYEIRHSVKPGVTGWAQVRYGYGATIDDARKKHQFDLYYVKNNSLLLDLLVLVETVSVVLFREGSQ